MISDFPEDGAATAIRGRRGRHGSLTAADRKGLRMNIIERTINDVTVLDLEGNLALNENARFRKHVTGAIDAGSRKLIVNLAKVKYMDSRGLGELISCYTALRRVNGNVKLLHLNNRLQYLLAITNLDSVFETFDSEPAALSSFAP
jgi:anti-sigma B factor antagonist